ncbi:hypothetical protein FPQ18DRAFT_257413 [Pyronema domesticum]|nr:hypothetical protein FPQ18DRAFT_257413 [Pyronema domesticum]
MVRFGIKEAHAAGIYSDMTSDGPVIGTLVVVLDRAKNLPNKKKIGKQDPYAVARLAKEAKRTDTDVRGGQVPKWDKELRFPVRDSPDYKTLKVSVFNDDKRTDLIGETTIRLDGILVPGGGTDDGWRNLSCKNKYAGEIQVELTFWDLRPKREKPKEPKKLPRPVMSFEDKAPEPLRKVGGAREMGQQRATVTKRRPLPAHPHRSSMEHLQEPEDYQRSSRRRQNGGEQYSRLPEANRHSMIDLSAMHRHNMQMGQDFGGGRQDFYDNGNYMQTGGYGHPEDFQDFRDDYYDQAPPPPPPAHRSFGDRNSNMDMHGQYEQQETAFQRQLRHHQSVPALPQHSVQHEQSLNSRQIAHLQQFQQLHMLEPSFPDAKFLHHPIPQLPPAGYDSLAYDDEPPPLAHVPTPVSSTPSSRDGPAPPPPPHRQLVVLPSPVLDEPNWDNHRPKSMAEEHGLPSYDSLTKLESGRRSSFDVAQGMSTSLPLPPSLIPGIDPALLDDVALERQGRYPAYTAQPLQIEAAAGPSSASGSSLQSRPSNSTNYHHPQVEDARDIGIYQDNRFSHSQGQLHIEQHNMKRKSLPRVASFVKPIPIHSERDTAVPAINASQTAMRKASVLNLRNPERKPVPSPSPEPYRQLTGTPFGPDSYDAINPNPVASLDALQGRMPPERMIKPGSNKVYDPSDVLPPESFAPEPEVKKRSPRPPPAVPVEHRRERIGGSVSPQPSIPGMYPPPSPQPPRSPSGFRPPPLPQKSANFNRGELRRSIRGSKSMAALPREKSLRDRYSQDMSGGMVLYDPQSEWERERQLERERAEYEARALVPMGYQQSQYGMEVGYYGRPQQMQLPPVPPPKLPMTVQQGMDENAALSQQLSLISIGANLGGGMGGGYGGGMGGGRRRRDTRW